MVDWRRRVERGWYEGSGWLTPLRPLGWLVGRVAGRRLRRFRRRAERPAGAGRKARPPPGKCGPAARTSSSLGLEASPAPRSSE